MPGAPRNIDAPEASKDTKNDIESRAFSRTVAHSSAAIANKEEVKRIPECVSKKLQALILFGTIGVFYIHAFTGDRSGYNFVCDPVPRNWAIATEAWIAGGLLRSAVPLFFTISGLLFFTRRQDDIPDFQFSRRIIQRVWSIGVPYVCWNVFGLAWKLVSWFVYDNWNCECCLSAVTKWFPLRVWFTPMMPQLWYLRDLLLLALLSPVLEQILKSHTSVVVAFFVAAAWPWSMNLGLYSILGNSFSMLELDGVIFFSLGAYLALKGADLERKLAGGWFAALTFVFVGGQVFKARWAAMSDKSDEEVSQIGFINHLLIPFGVAFAWFGYDRIEDLVTSKSVWPWCAWASTYSMWLYCAHVPFICRLTTFMLEAFDVLGVGPGWHLALFLLSPLVTVAFLFAVGVPMSRHCPRAFGLLTGGRGGS